jgi:hypothetical protein
MPSEFNFSDRRPLRTIHWWVLGLTPLIPLHNSGKVPGKFRNLSKCKKQCNVVGWYGLFAFAGALAHTKLSLTVK